MNRFKSSTIVFTSYRNDVETEQALLADGCSWYLYGHEICPDTGRAHLQGMANCKKSISWGKIRSMCHVEKCKDPIASIEYCRKDNKFQEWGTMPVFDKVKRAVKVKDLLHLTNEEWGELDPRFYNAAVKAQASYVNQTMKPLETESVRGVWYYGPPDAGKDHVAKS